MAGTSLRLEVITPERLVFREEVEAIIVPAAEGYLGILPNHTPLITSLSVGVMRYRKNGGIQRVAVGGGFMEVAANRVTVLADTAERAEEIDVDRARRAKARAEARLRDRPPNLDYARAEMALRRALTRLKAAGQD